MTPLSRKIKIRSCKLQHLKRFWGRNINIRRCEDYKNTFARMESDCTLIFGFKALIKSVSYTKQSNLFLHFLSMHLETLQQKLVLCRSLKFAFPQRVSSIEVKASFEKAYWSLEPHLENDDLKELAAATLRSVALNYAKYRNLPRHFCLPSNN